MPVVLGSIHVDGLEDPAGKVVVLWRQWLEDQNGEEEEQRVPTGGIILCSIGEHQVGGVASQSPGEFARA
jgi:hypothetical protein